MNLIESRVHQFNDLNRSNHLNRLKVGVLGAAIIIGISNVFLNEAEPEGISEPVQQIETFEASNPG